MPHSFGLRARTRAQFSRGFRQHGAIPLSTYLRLYKIGDIVDIKANGAVQKGMPHKFYHGRTGVIFNVTKSSVGVLVHKRVGNRFMEKRINVRVEHVKPSKSRQDFLERVKVNDEKRREWSKANAHLQGADLQAAKFVFNQSLKRLPVGPREARFVAMTEVPVSIAPKPFENIL